MKAQVMSQENIALLRTYYPNSFFFYIYIYRNAVPAVAVSKQNESMRRVVYVKNKMMEQDSLAGSQVSFLSPYFRELGKVVR